MTKTKNPINPMRLNFQNKWAFFKSIKKNAINIIFTKDTKNIMLFLSEKAMLLLYIMTVIRVKNTNVPNTIFNSFFIIAEQV